MRPVVLDLDGSVGRFDGDLNLALPQWGERLRFACSRRALRAFGRELDARLPDDAGTVFLGSGDYHHLSLPLIERAAATHGPLEVVVFDNHPDNMRFPFGVHCGSWVQRVAALPGVAHVHMVGITSGDIGLAHAWENRILPLWRGRLTYWSCDVDVRWARRVGLGAAFRSFADIPAMLDAFAARMAGHARPVYLSIDKDVLSAEDVQTNWDQGRMRVDELLGAIAGLHGRIVGSDINGEVSPARYAQGWKRLLSALDKQPEIPQDRLRQWQAQQHALNQRLLSAIDAAWTAA